MPTFKQKNPCPQCPFRKNALPGWLGDYTPKEVIDTINHEEAFLCHTQIDYSDPDWKETQAPFAPVCAGQLMMTRRMCKLPRDPEHSAAVKAIVPSDEIFKNHREFIEHHQRGRDEVVAIGRKRST